MQLLNATRRRVRDNWPDAVDRALDSLIKSVQAESHPMVLRVLIGDLSSQEAWRRGGAARMLRSGWREHDDYDNIVVPLVVQSVAREQNDFARADFVDLLGDSEYVDVMPVIRGRYTDDSPHVRAAVARALPNVCDEPLDRETLQVLLDLTVDPVDQVRDWACFSVGTALVVDTPAVREALVARLSDNDDETGADTAHEAARGLALRGDLRALPFLRDRLQRPSDEIGLLVLEAAGWLREASLVPYLWDLAENQWADESRHAATARWAVGVIEGLEPDPALALSFISQRT